MQRSSGHVIEGLAAFLLAPILVPLGLIAQLLPKRTIDRSPDEVIGFITGFLEETGGDWDWDEFETVPITDAELDALRQRAALAGPPDADFTELRAILAEAQEIAQRGAAPSP